MSIDITATSTGTGTWQARCLCRDHEGGSAQHTFSTYAEADAWLAEYRQAPVVLEGCTDDLCPVYGPILTEVQGEGEVPCVNMANSNAVEVLDALGLIERDSTGSIIEREQMLSGQDFLGRIMLAEALAPVSAHRPSMTVPSDGSGATMVHCARREGYLQDRLVALREVAEWAIKHGQQVTWS